MIYDIYDAPSHQELHYAMCRVIQFLTTRGARIDFDVLTTISHFYLSKTVLVSYV